MHVKSMQRLDDPARNGWRTLCRFALQLTPDCLLYDLKLKEAPDGQLKLFTPTWGRNAPVASMSPGLREKIIKIAREAYHDEFDRAA